MTLIQKRKKAAASRKNTTRPSGQWIRSDLRLAIYLRDEFRCVYCGRNLYGVDPQDCTLDHVHPYSLGGENTSNNLITACRSCNCSRGAKRVTEYSDAHTQKTIRRQTARKIDKYRAQAKAIIAGECVEEFLSVG